MANVFISLMNTIVMLVVLVFAAVLYLPRLILRGLYLALCKIVGATP